MIVTTIIFTHYYRLNYDGRLSSGDFLASAPLDEAD